MCFCMNRPLRACLCPWLSMCVYRSEWKGDRTRDVGSVEVDMVCRLETEHSAVCKELSEYIIKIQTQLVYWTLLSFWNKFFDPEFKYNTVEMLFIVWHFCFFALHLNNKCVLPFAPESLARLSTSVMICFLDQAVPELGPAHWSWTIYNLRLSALGTVPSIQSHGSGLKPGSSVLNNDWSSNVLTPALTHRPSCFSAPACINRSVYSGVRTSFLWSPLWALHRYSLGPVR